ncbi:MAG TPA: DPP IV N-terminal domain-containing protein, partial [Lysobacter sp.]|nr:DPP IV N-terminal domain-containing protein [Lysobacter sp.]
MGIKFGCCAGVLVSLAIMGSAYAQAAQVTAADYERATKMLGDRTTPLIDGWARGATWLDDGSVVYATTSAGKSSYQRFDPATGKAVPAFNQKALAAAMQQAAPKGGKAVDPDTLQVMDVKRDGDALLLGVRGGNYRCDAKGCASVTKPKSGDEPGVASPDGKREAFVRDWNLWLRDTASGKETQLTFDGKPDYGYATDNAGWKHTNEAVVAWSPDGRKIASFRQDQRRTSTMTLVGTNVGAPKVEQWKYPFVGDKDVTMIERIVIDLSGARPATIPLQMPPDQHRSTCADDVVCDNGWEDVQWARDGRTLAFVSTDRGHKSATLRVADAATGKVRDVYSETVATQYQSAPALSSVNWRYLPESNEFLWYSEKSNWGHLYLH